MSNIDKRLLDAIPDGIENAISLNDLSKRLGVGERDLKNAITQARLRGVMICCFPLEQIGYYRPLNTGEALKCYRYYRKKKETTARIVDVMRKYFLDRGEDPDEDLKERRESNV